MGSKAIGCVSAHGSSTLLNEMTETRAQIFEKDYLPPTIHYQQPDPECDLDYIPNEGRNSHVDYILSNSFGFGGINAVLVFGRFSQ